MIDAHIHFWRRDRGDYFWLTSALAPLFRDFMPEDFVPLAAAGGVQGLLLVHAAETEAETDFCVDLARRTPMILGVVGWLDLARQDAASALQRMIARSGTPLKGVRAALEDRPDAFIADEGCDRVFDALADAGLTLEVMATFDQLPLVAERMTRTPSLRVVIDHAARPPWSVEDRPRWRRALSSVADRGAFAKFSGLLDQLATKDEQDFGSIFNDLQALFGIERLMWGSDWPVLRLSGSYGDYLSLSQRATVNLSVTQQARLFDGTVREAYRLEASL